MYSGAGSILRRAYPYSCLGEPSARIRRLAGEEREQANPTEDGGGRAQLLANEWIVRRQNVIGEMQIAQCTKRSMRNGVRQSANVVCKESLHPDLATGFHCLARMRAGGYQS